MKHLILILLTVFLTGCAGTGEREFFGMLGMSSFQNEPDGFRGIKWGQDASEINDLELQTKNNEGLASYHRPGDLLSLGDAQLNEIQYKFWDNKFMEASMTATPSQIQALVNVLTEKYGAGYRPNIYIRDYSWAGPVAFVRLQQLSPMSNCQIYIRSREVYDRYIIYRGQKAKAGAEFGAKNDF